MPEKLLWNGSSRARGICEKSVPVAKKKLYRTRPLTYKQGSTQYRVPVRT